MLAVLVADADPLAARLLAADLRRVQKFRVMECIPDVSSVVECIAANLPDIVLISTNVRIDAPNRLALLRRIRSEFPGTRVIALLEGSERRLVAELFRVGVRGIFDRSEYNLRRLCRCIRSVAGGQVWAKSDQISFVLDVLAETAPLHIINAEGDDLLTRRENDVVRLVAEGLGNREVAQELGLSEHTIKNYLFNIFDKLGISSRSELVMYTLSNRGNTLGSSGESGQSEKALLRPPAMMPMRCEHLKR